MWFLKTYRVPKNLKLWLKVTAIVIVNLVCLKPTIAEETASSYNAKNDSKAIAQAPSTSQLEVQSNHWAFQALQSLVERYDCIAEYPNNIYQSNRTLTRYEFAADLNTCLKRISEVSTSTTANLTKEDLATLNKLQSEFSAELTDLQNRVNSLDSRTAQLEENQFSTTVKLSGSVVFSGLNYFSGEGENQFVLQQQTYLNLSASFTGRDNLSLGVTASNAEIPEFVSTNNGRDVGSTREGLTTWEYGGSTNNSVALSTLEYTFPIIDREDQRLNVSLAFLNGFNTSQSLPAVGYMTRDGRELGTGPVSAFGQKSPIYRLGSGAGVITQYDLESLRLTLAYLASQASDPSDGRGFFDGDSLAFAQLNFTPSDRFALALTYQHNYFGSGRFAYSNQSEDPDSPGFVGTALANRFDNEGVFFDENVSVVSNSYGIQAYWQLSSQVEIASFVAKTDARLLGRGDADILSYGLILNFPDLGKEGNQGGLILGVEPTLTNIDAVGVSSKDFKRDTSLHAEVFYQHQLTDNISITPGVVWITAPNQDANNEDIIEGVIRTTFSF